MRLHNSVATQRPRLTSLPHHCACTPDTDYSPLDVICGAALGVVILVVCGSVSVPVDEQLMTNVAAPFVAIAVAIALTWAYPRPEKVCGGALFMFLPLCSSYNSYCCPCVVTCRNGFAEVTFPTCARTVAVGKLAW